MAGAESSRTPFTAPISEAQIVAKALAVPIPLNEGSYARCTRLPLIRSSTSGGWTKPTAR